MIVWVFAAKGSICPVRDEIDWGMPPRAILQINEFHLTLFRHVSTSWRRNTRVLWSVTPSLFIAVVCVCSSRRWRRSQCELVVRCETFPTRCVFRLACVYFNHSHMKRDWRVQSRHRQHCGVQHTCQKFTLPNTILSRFYTGNLWHILTLLLIPSLSTRCMWKKYKIASVSNSWRFEFTSSCLDRSNFVRCAVPHSTQPQMS